jgi:enoyl-CoA hydratase/carnithine racemase
MTASDEHAPSETVNTEDLRTDSRVEIDDVADGVRLIAFNRPAVRNAFDTAMYLAFTQALLDADRDERVRAVVITGRGAGFSSGQDLREMAAIATGNAVEGSGRGFTGLLDALTEASVPLLAAVNGVAVGLGFTMLGHCDLVLVDEASRLRVPFAELGVPAEAASSVLFPARMGWQRAARVLLTSDWIGADEAVELGMALRVCAAGTVVDETVALAARIATHPRPATRAITALMREGQRELVRSANVREQAAFGRLLGGAASAGALAEFTDKTAP